MATQSDVYSAGSTRISVGLSAIIKVTPLQYQQLSQLKIFSGGGTLEVVPTPIALSGSSAAGWGLGYPVGASEVVTMNGPAVFYLAATGATMVAALLVGLTAGATIVI